MKVEPVSIVKTNLLALLMFSLLVHSIWSACWRRPADSEGRSFPTWKISGESTFKSGRKTGLFTSVQWKCEIYKYVSIIVSVSIDISHLTNDLWNAESCIGKKLKVIKLHSCVVGGKKALCPFNESQNIQMNFLEPETNNCETDIDLSVMCKGECIP